jgi:hypothetical protein
VLGFARLTLNSITFGVGFFPFKLLLISNFCTSNKFDF